MSTPLDPNAIRKNFPLFETNPDLVYLDSAATALKPRSMVEAMNLYYFEYSTNVARGLYPLAERATTALDTARQTVAHFVQAKEKESVIFTSNATHAINLVALGLEHHISAKNNIIVTELEHHSNYLPWKELARRTEAELRIAHFTPDGTIDLHHLTSLIDEQTTVVAFSAVSNVFGVMHPVAEMIQTIRRKNPQTLVIVDACQAAGHIPIDIQAWDADFTVFSGHKLFGPTGIGVLAGKQRSLTLLTPMNVGGGTVLDAQSPKTEYKPLPDNLEGGTPNIAGAIGLAAAIEYIETLGIESIHSHEVMLSDYAIRKLTSEFGKRIHFLSVDDSSSRTGILSFTLDGLHPHDIAHLLGEENICVRAGEHCASVLHRTLHLPATTRISLSIYSTKADIDRLVSAMQNIRLILG